MSLEEDIRAYLAADAELTDLLPGGIYTWGGLGRAGLTRANLAAAFNAGGYLRPCAVIRQREERPDGRLADEESGTTSTEQQVEISLYEDITFSALDAAVERVYALLHGHSLAGALPAAWAATADRLREKGALKGAANIRMTFVVRRVRSII